MRTTWCNQTLDLMDDFKIYTFTFEVVKSTKQTHIVTGTDRDKALASATAMMRAEQRGEPDVTIELVEESSRTRTNV